MDTVTIIACRGSAWYSDIIKMAEHGQYTHIAGLILDSTLESQGIKDVGDKYPGVWLHPPSKYIDGQDCKFIAVGVKNLDAMKDKAREILGTPYSFHGCIEAGLEMLFDLKPPTDGELTMMCSETWDVLLRVGEPINCTLPDFKPDFVAPQRLFDAISQGAV